MIYFSEIFTLQHTDRTRKMNKLIISSNTRLKINDNIMI